MSVKVRVWQSHAKHNKYVEMPPEVAKFLKDRGIEMPQRETPGFWTSSWLAIPTLGLNQFFSNVGKDLFSDFGGTLKAAFTDDFGNFSLGRAFDSDRNPYDANGNLKEGWFSPEEWEFALKGLSNAQEEIASQAEQLMTMIHDFMGQYSSYLSGANSALRSANQLMAGLSRGPSE